MKQVKVVSMLDFLNITKDNVHLYCRFDQLFKEDLSNFLSSIYPEKSDFFVVLIEKKLLSWSYLFHDGKIIGSIWLQREQATLPVATLGIFISEKELRSQGIGEQAIKEFLAVNRKEMKLKEVNIEVRKDNIRAIKCFEKCDFKTESEYVNMEGFDVINMIKSL